MVGWLQVDAEPPASYFRWSFNSTPGIARDLSQFTTDQGISVLTYTPKVAADYGTIQCWGKNALGSQRLPCTYHLVPAGKPDPPIGCGVTNTTHKTVSVSCQKGFDGGLKQRYVIIKKILVVLIVIYLMQIYFNCKYNWRSYHKHLLTNSGICCNKFGLFSRIYCNCVCA